jgi:hypothetical protein
MYESIALHDLPTTPFNVAALHSVFLNVLHSKKNALWEAVSVRSIKFGILSVHLKLPAEFHASSDWSIRTDNKKNAALIKYKQDRKPPTKKC